MTRFSGDCDTNRGNTFSISMKDISERYRKFNETTGQWLLKHYKSDYKLYHVPKYDGINKNHTDHLAHYQAEQGEELVTSFRDNKYHVIGHINGGCMATLQIKFFDDFKGTIAITCIHTVHKS